MGAHIRAFDWQATPIGAPQVWPPELRTVLRLMLTTGHPVVVFWGPELLCFYNDAFSRSLGPEKHPGILGQPAHEAWSEVWPAVSPQIQQVMRGEGPTWHENQRLPIRRHGGLQEVYWTYSYAPIDNARAPHGVGGVLVLVTETSAAVQAQQRLAAGELRWRSLFDQAPGFVAILTGSDFRYEFVNPRYQALVGGRPLLGLTVREAIPEAEAQGFCDLLTDVFREGRALAGSAVPLTLTDSPGHERKVYVDFVYQPIRDELGAVTGIFVQGSDVTDQVVARLDLVASEERYRALAEHLPGGAVFVVDHDLRYVTAVGEALGQVGMRSEDFVGRTVREVQGNEKASKYEADFRRALQGEAFETHHQDRGHYWLSRGGPLRDSGGNVTGALAASYDITKRLEMEQQLVRAGAKLESVLSSAEVGIWSWHLASGRVEQDANVARLFGIPGELTTSAAHVERILPEDRPGVERSVAEALSSGVLYIREFRVRHDDGQVLWLAGRGRVSLDATGKPEWMTGLVIDIGDLKALEQSLRDTDRQKDEFLAMLAHELRNPLAPIRNAGEILGRLSDADPRIKGVSDILRRQSNLLSRLVDDLLDVSRITHRRIELASVPVKVADIVGQAVETVAPLIQSKHHHITVSSAGVHTVKGDPARLVQCVVNVLGNAAKYTDPGGSLSVETFGEDAEVVVRVTDNGLGIGPELLPRVFDLFVQNSRTLDRSQGGLGIGLSLVKRLVEMHGGRVTASSAGSGLGSVFEIRLPRWQGVEASKKTATDASLRPLRILVVDDNVDAAETLGLMLGLDGHRVETENSAAHAAQRIIADPPEVVFLDIGLPVVDGYEVARRVRAAQVKVPLVALTGYGQAEDRVRALQEGFDDFLVKPCTQAGIQACLARLMASRKDLGSSHSVPAS